MKTAVTIDGHAVTVDLLHTGEALEATVNGTTYRAIISREDDEWRILIGDQTILLTVVTDRNQAWIELDGEV